MVALFHVDITKHINIQNALRESEEKLDREARRLKDANIALNVLLEHREEEKIRTQENIMHSISKLINPFITILKETQLSDDQLSLLNTIEANLDEIITPFAGNLSYRFARLTRTEMKVAVLVKEGRTTKEISNILYISEPAVCFHRRNIREKLGIKHKKINLYSFLQQMKKSNFKYY
jgi:DNA-binding CsgD family transcriptional regulator